MGDAGEHLAHGGELLRLNELLFETLERGDVAAGGDHALDFSFFTVEGAQVDADHAPLAIAVADAGLEGGEVLAPLEQTLEGVGKLGAIFLMDAWAISRRKPSPIS